MNPWDIIIMQPMINVLVVLSSYLFSNFGLAIIALTIITRGLMYPLTVKQLRSTKAVQALQPKLAELQKKYAKDKNKLAKEQMRLYKEAGVSPAGCLLPMLAQMPIWIALYWSIMKVLAVSPEDFLGLSRYLYSWPVVYSVLPLNNRFLWMDLSTPDLFLALLVGGSMWLQQKMTTPATVDPRQQTTSQMMLWIMPIMFFYLSLQFSSGLALYWVASNIIGIAMQYFVTGWGGLARPRRVPDKKYKERVAQSETSTKAAEPSLAKGGDNAGVGDKRQDRRTGHPKGVGQVRRQPRTSRRHHPK